MKGNQGELDIIEVKDFFKRYEVKLKLTTTFNLEANSKSERGHPFIINALIKAYRNKPRQ